VLGFALIALSLVGGATLLGYVTSGWTDLEARYPDRAERPLRTFGFRAARISDGWKYGFSFGPTLVFQPCAGGLRVAMMRPFSFVCGSFFVPWEDVIFEPFPLLFQPASIVFGKPMVGVATVSARLAQKIAHARPSG